MRRLMKLSNTAIGLAVRAARDAAKLTLSDLSSRSGLPISSLSRAENGLRGLDFSEAVVIADALNVSVGALQSLAETFEREGAVEIAQSKKQLMKDLLDLQRQAVEIAISSANGIAR